MDLMKKREILILYSISIGVISFIKGTKRHIKIYLFRMFISNFVPEVLGGGVPTAQNRLFYL